jgi:hypothetical protein
VIVDIDGTLALRTTRGPYEHRGVGNDRVNEAVVRVVQALARDGLAVVLVTGRSEVSRRETELWLTMAADLHWDGLFMRADEDLRTDSVVKREMLSAIHQAYVVVCVFDDRDQTVAMWREAGLSCFQVASGDF